MTLDEVESIKRRDAVKTEYCIGEGIRLVRIPYTKIKGISNILEEEIYGEI